MSDLEIQIIWSENKSLHNLSIELQQESATKFHSFEEFDKALADGASQSVVELGYDKTKFLVIYRSEGYEGRFDLKPKGKRQETSTGKISLAQHMKDNLNFILSGKYKSSEEDVEFAKTWLNYLHEIEQITQQEVNSKNPA